MHTQHHDMLSQEKDQRFDKYIKTIIFILQLTHIQGRTPSHEIDKEKTS